MLRVLIRSTCFHRGKINTYLDTALILDIKVLLPFNIWRLSEWMLIKYTLILIRSRLRLKNGPILLALNSYVS